jgi:SAM-dependent methyltransferase
MAPLATIVVTAFDREESLKRLLVGLDNQSTAPGSYEVVIADDSGETRLGQRVLKDIATNYDLSLVRTNLPYEVNGVSVARNKGIEKARGQIIISIDDDCFPSFFFVEEHIAAHQRNYPVIVLGHRSCDASKLKEDRPISITEPKSTKELVVGGAGQLNYSNFMTGNISLLKQVAMEVGRFNEIFAQPGEHGNEDIELGYRLWRKGIPTVFARNAMIYRPPTENEKEQRRAATKAVEKASHRLLRLHPLLPLVKRFLNAVHSNRHDLAIKYGKVILSKDPQHWPVLLLQGDLLGLQGAFEAAQQHFNQAMLLYDRNPAVYLKLAQLMFRQNRLKASWDYTQKTLELQPDQTGALYLAARLQPWRLQTGNDAVNGTPEINIELGGGVFPTKIRDEGHNDYINLDAINTPSADVVTDLSQGIPIPDGTVSHIFSREMIEHLPYRKLPDFIKECYRVLKPGGAIFLSCPDFEAIVKLYHRQCECFKEQKADPACPLCKGSALISKRYWRANLLGDQNDYGDGGSNDTHKNQITYASLCGLLKEVGFVNIVRDTVNPYYESEKRLIKLSVTCHKPQRQSGMLLAEKYHDGRSSIAESRTCTH